VPGRRESADVARVAEQIRGDDRTDTVHIGDRRVRRRDGDLDTATELDERLVDAADLVEELRSDPFAFDPDRITWTELAELERGPFR
jgi:hypothetical protein